MRAIQFGILLLAVAVSLFGASKREPDLVVLLHHDNVNLAIVGAAERNAGQMLASAGVSVAWQGGSARDRASAEVIEAVLTHDADDAFKPGALAFATLGPSSATRIDVLYNRLRSTTREADVARVLAHVLVHEITHILEGVNRHSSSGVMKASWDLDDRKRMRVGPLPFNAEDLQLIQAWKESRGRKLLASAR